jgi:hypothetical protein
MSFFRNRVRRQTLPVQAGLSRLLLLGRFDLRHKVWSLPVFDNPQDAAMTLNSFVQVVLPARVSAPASSVKNVTRRIKSRPRLSGFFEKSK